MPDNHAILLTGSGLAAIAVIRLSGPAVPAFVQKHFSRPAKLGRCVHGNLVDGSRTIDDPVIVLISPTAADINLHGSPWIIRSTLDLARSNGFEAVEYTSDFAALDVPEGPNLLWQEVLQWLPLARTEQVVKMLLAQPAAWEDLMERMERGSISAREIQGIQNDRSLHWMLSLPRVAIIGPPNVGKSTLANRLFGQDRSIMADIPGTTRDWVGEIANIDGLAVTLIDTAGRRHTLDPIEAAAIAAGSAEAITADLIILVLDHSAALDSHTHDLIDSYPEALIVANKSDRPPAWNAVDLNSVTTVALTQMGMDTLRQKIRRHFGCDDEESGRPRWWTQRQRDFLTGRLMGAK